MSLQLSKSFKAQNWNHRLLLQQLCCPMIIWRLIECSSWQWIHLPLMGWSTAKEKRTQCRENKPFQTIHFCKDSTAFKHRFQTCWCMKETSINQIFYQAIERYGNYLLQHALKPLYFIFCIISSFGHAAFSCLQVDLSMPESKCLIRDIVYIRTQIHR